MITKKTIAPDFRLRNQKNEIIALTAFKGKRILLFFAEDMSNIKVQTTMAFYAKHQTLLEQLNVEILAIVGNNQEMMQARCAYLQLPYHVLCDDQKEVAQQYGVWNKKITFGKEHWMMFPYGFVLDEAGVLTKVFKRMFAHEKQAQVLEYLQHLVKKAEWRKLSRRKKERIRREQAKQRHDVNIFEKG